MRQEPDCFVAHASRNDDDDLCIFLALMTCEVIDWPCASTDTGVIEEVSNRSPP